MKLDIYVVERDAYENATTHFSEFPNVNVILGSITQTSSPCVISAGQSFGMMNGGVDGVLNTFLSSHTPNEYVQSCVKRAIADQCAGELGVGQALCVPTKHPRVRALVYAATMRVPEPVPNTLNAYLAFRSAIVEAVKHGFLHVATPLMCTGAGEMPVERACRQMRAAYESVLNGGDVGENFMYIHKRHRALEQTLEHSG